MDPLSISAAIVALIGAANQVAIGLNKLASLKGASAAILQLNNEVSDLRLILQETEHLLLRHRQAAGPDLATCAATSVDEPLLLLSIDQARNNLMDVESLIQNRLMTRLGVIDKLGWLLDQDKVRKAKENIRKAKLDITAALGVVSS